MSLIFVDCEAWGGCPGTGALTEIGAVDYDTRQTFYADLRRCDTPDGFTAFYIEFVLFDKWIRSLPEPWIFISDNPAFDWQWINDGFWRVKGANPFGHSARRIGDYYAGLCGKFRTPAWEWKKLRVTKHDHNPVNDAMGNVEAFTRMEKGERGRR